MPDFNVQSSTSDHEEFFLIKWRGHSYLHYSWECRSDMEKFDLTGTILKIKVRRYVQAQESLFGINWKRIAEKKRTEIHRHIHPYGLHAWDDTTTDGQAPTEEEDFFLLYYLEVERILACDESKMDQKVFAGKMALNLQKALFEMEWHNQGKKWQLMI